MDTNKQLHVHFMGICGSGCASVAMLAHSLGYKVSGCDQSAESYYAQELKKLGIEIFVGHSASHLTEDVDIVAVSPALFDISPDNEELKAAEAAGILMTWQEFMGKHLQQNKRVIAISGTHGKTTTTFMTAELLIHGGVDPSVLGGSVYKKWGNGGRSGKSDWFLCEADEFNRNFHNYKAEIAVLNNVEMDHPECYNSYEEVIDSFAYFVSNSEKLNTLILNADSKGAMEVLQKVSSSKNMETVKVYAFTKDYDKDFSDCSLPVIPVYYETVSKEVKGTTFAMSVMRQRHEFFMRLYGEYNVSNAVVSTLISMILGVSDEKIQESLKDFSGVGRRFDFVGEMRNVPVYDDYAHHPTEIASVLGMTKDYFPDKNIVAVFEPHQVSRLRLMLDEYANALMIADKIIICKTHLGREIHKDVKPIQPQEWFAYSDRFSYEEDNLQIKKMISDLLDKKECDMIVVIGAANSYKISRLLCED